MHTFNDGNDDAMLCCLECGELHALPPSQPPPDDDDINDLELFRALHRQHHLEPAYRLNEPPIHDRPAWDPMARRWFRVSVGATELVVCSSRSSIEEPRTHRICDTPPQFSVYTEVDVPMLQRALHQHFHPNHCSETKFRSFIDAVRDAYTTADSETCEISFDDPSLANAEIGPCPRDVLELLHQHACEIFDEEWERNRILDFIESNDDEYGALAIRVRREIHSADLPSHMHPPSQIGIEDPRG